MKIFCEACKLEAETKSNGIAPLEEILPPRWKRRLIDGRSYILCDICGHPKQLMGAFSPYLIDALGLDEHAICEEIPEREDFYAPRANKKSANKD